MDRVVVIANPVASQFTGGAHRDVMAHLDKVSRVEAVWPSSASEASAQARKAADDGVDIVVAMGGDGMVHHVSQGLVGTDSSLGVIPAGTTNVFARLLRIPSKPIRAARLLAASLAPRQVGVAKMTLRRGTTETVHYSIFACGFGLDASVVQLADKDPYRKYRFGSIHYLTTTLGVVFGEFPGRDPNLTIRAANQELEGTAALLQFREVYTFFGLIPLQIEPTKPDPMTALTIEKLSRLRLPQLATAISLGRDLGSVPGFHTWTGVDRISIDADPAVAAQADGEALGTVDGGVVEWLPDSLRVIAPHVS